MYVASASSVAFIAVGYLTHVVVLTLSVRWFFDFCTGRVSSDCSYVLMHVVSPLSWLCFKGFRVLQSTCVAILSNCRYDDFSKFAPVGFRLIVPMI